MATVEQIKQEIIDNYNDGVREYNEQYRDSYGEAEEAESFETAFRGSDIDGVWDAMWGDGVDLPSGKAKQVKEWSDGDYGVTAVFSIGNQFFMITGSYNSWDGYEWYGKLVEVFPKEEVKIRYYEKGK